ncbi:carbohydrate ABC transporter permease [Promicromonospora soli]|uniref:Cytochrome c biogenesis protein n=1 Tax=Promicromonospora soli TaxID=2035533 RepID=A0A919KN05_9MICO|nr:sugar ABC transporter permease [Promicromonospora soli]GHH66380.1 cytochrome c biogenesis protein [Promicromonospora soli]
MTLTASTVPAGVHTSVRSRRRRAVRAWPAYVAIAPFFILFLSFGLYPTIYSLVLSFQKWNGLGSPEWVGLDNYVRLATDDTFWLSVRNTFVIFAISTIPMMLLALAVAAMLNNAVRYSTALRIAYFVPNITSVVAMAILFGAIFGESFGLMNAFLNAVGIPDFRWLSTPLGLQLTISILITYQWTGYNAIIFLAGMQSIDSEVYEAAKVDGAGPVRTFFSITLPLLRPTLIFVLIVSTITGLQSFTEAQVLTSGPSTTNPNSGGAGQGGLTMVLYFYQQAFSHNKFGYGASIAWGIFLIVLVFVIISWRYSVKREDPTR